MTSFDRYDHNDLVESDFEFFKEEVIRHKDQLQNENIENRK